MPLLNYKIGDATKPEAEGHKVITHICNDRGKWGKGFVVALSKMSPLPEQSYRQWHETLDGDLPQGEVQFVRVKEDLSVANIIGQVGLYPKKGIPPIRYDSVRAGLEKVATYCLEHQATVHMPRMGAGLAGGEWPLIEAIVLETLVNKGIETTVYDLA